MDIEYNGELLEINTTEALDDLIEKYSSEIREKGFEEEIKYLDITKK